MNLSEFKTIEELAAALVPLLRQQSRHIFGDGTGSITVRLNGAAGTDRQIQFQTNAVNRWIMRGADNESEGGSNSGSNFALLARTDAGGFLRTQLEITRSNGDMNIPNVDFSSVSWRDYFSSSTVTGWAGGMSETNIAYKRIGNLVLVNYRLYGTSNSTTTSFTLPYDDAGFGNPIWAYRAQNNGSVAMSYGQFVGASLVGLSPTPGVGHTSWTASGIKSAYGQFFYEAA